MPLTSSCTPIYGRTADLNFIGALGESMKPVVFLPAQFIITAGHITRCMWFIKRGRVEFITPPEKAGEGPHIVEKKVGHRRHRHHRPSRHGM